jgi:hypothetical protein
MTTRVKYLHGDKTGQVEELEDDVYAKTLLDTGYAEVPPPPEPETPKAKAAAKKAVKKAAKKAPTKAKRPKGK